MFDKKYKTNNSENFSKISKPEIFSHLLSNIVRKIIKPFGLEACLELQTCKLRYNLQVLRGKKQTLVAGDLLCSFRENLKIQKLFREDR